MLILERFSTKSTAKKQLEKNEDGEKALDEIEKQLMQIMEKHGVKKIDALGKKFDFNLHECMMTAHEKDKQDELVLEEFQKGYLLNGKILRPAKVKVNKKE